MAELDIKPRPVWLQNNVLFLVPHCLLGPRGSKLSDESVLSFFNPFSLSNGLCHSRHPGPPGLLFWECLCPSVPAVNSLSSQ